MNPHAVLYLIAACAIGVLAFTAAGFWLDRRRPTTPPTKASGCIQPSSTEFARTLGDFTLRAEEARNALPAARVLHRDALRWIATHGDSQSAALAATALNTQEKP